MYKITDRAVASLSLEALLARINKDADIFNNFAHDITNSIAAPSSSTASGLVLATPLFGLGTADFPLDIEEASSINRGILSSADWNMFNEKADSIHAHLVSDITDMSSWAGSTALTTLGIVATGTWQATPIADSFIASAVTWSAKANSGANIDITSLGSLASIKPASDSTTAIQVKNAAGTTFATFDTTNKWANFGSADTPENPLSVVSSVSTTPFRTRYIGNGNANITQQRARGTPASPTAVVANSSLGTNAFAGYDGVGYTLSAQIVARAVETFTNSPAARGTSIEFSVAPAGGSSMVKALFIDSSGYVGLGSNFSYLIPPSERLHVDGSALVEQTYSYKGMDSGLVPRAALAISITDDIEVGHSEVSWGTKLKLMAGTTMDFMVNGSSGAHSTPLTLSSTVMTLSQEFKHTGATFGMLGASPVTQAAGYTLSSVSPTRTMLNISTSTLTDSTGGSAGTTIAAVSGTPDDAGINNALARIIAQVNQLKAELDRLTANTKSALTDIKGIGVTA